MMDALLKPGGLILLLGKDKGEDADLTVGPPFHLTSEMLMKRYFSKGYTLLHHVDVVYTVGHPQWKQQAFIIQKDIAIQ